jgi:uncharacterized membrane protein
MGGRHGRAWPPSAADRRRIVIALFSGALVVAALFTLLPGQIMRTMVFGD